MSTITLTLKITLEDILDPSDTPAVSELFESHFEALFDRGFLDSYGTVYDYHLEAEYDANDT